MGYRVEWNVFNSKHFGVPQNRERVYITGYFGERGGSKILSVAENTGSAKIKILGSTKGDDCTRQGHRDLCYSPDGVVGALKATDYKQPVQILELKELTQNQSQGYRVYDPNGVAPTQASQAGGLGAKTGLVAIPVLTPDKLKKRQNGRRMKTDGEPMFTLTAQDRHGIYDGIKVRRLTPLECERVMGFPDNWTLGKSDSARYKMLGNALTPQIPRAIIKELIK